MRVFFLIGLLGFLALPVRSETLNSHASYIASVNAELVDDITDVDAVFARILSTLPEIVNVLTTENYAYFTFYDKGVAYQGNMRLEHTADGPVLNFLYNPRPAPWLPNPKSQQKIYRNGVDGVTVTSENAFQFGISFQGINRSFRHLDVSKILPPIGMLRTDEVFMGQVHDDSGLRFFLTYDVPADTPLYILDQTQSVAEQFFMAENAEGETFKDIRVGARTGFAFIVEPGIGRMRLVGVHASNIQRNNYFDGPFDQLPDSYHGAFSVRQVYEKRDPENAAKMDRNGVFVDGSGFRAVIDPYLSYDDFASFAPIGKCLANFGEVFEYRLCMATAIGF